MVYRLMGRLHALTLRSERGQGTVEYVGLILLIAGVIGAVVTFGKDFTGGADFGQLIVDKLRNSIDGLKGK